MEPYLEFAGRHPLLITAALVLVGLIIFNELRIRMRGFSALAPEAAVRLINGGAVVLDLREREQFEAGHIVNAQHQPASALKSRASELDKFRDKPVLAYCETGVNSARAAGTLHELGFEQVAHLQGGLAAWRRENLPVASKRKERKRKQSGKRAAAG